MKNTKIPVNSEGLKAIKILKSQGVSITATIEPEILLDALKMPAIIIFAFIKIIYTWSN